MTVENDRRILPTKMLIKKYIWLMFPLNFGLRFLGLDFCIKAT